MIGVVVTRGYGSFGSIAAIVLAGFTASDQVPVAHAAERTFMIAAENRYLLLEAESREWSISAERRLLS